MSEAEQKEPEGIALRVDWHIPDGTQSLYANNVLVQAGQYEITISFFEAQIPVLLGQPEENRRKLEELGSVRAELVSRIVVSPEILPVLIKALETGLENYRQAKGQA
jgi:Protein of unknown function (DUF3467)